MASATLNKGLQFSYELGVDSSLSRVASLTVTKAHAAEVAEKPAPAKKAAPKKKETGLIMPAKGIDWGIIHSHNGVDIANKCGTPIHAAASGTVDAIGSGWNGGYGNAVGIKHANGTETYYAHLTAIEVEDGEKVTQGEEIGTMGITGEATGCHLHFEVHGGINPFGK